jgi:hypothetical protein
VIISAPATNVDATFVIGVNGMPGVTGTRLAGCAASSHPSTARPEERRAAGCPVWDVFGRLADRGRSVTR